MAEVRERRAAAAAAAAGDAAAAMDDVDAVVAAAAGEAARIGGVFSEWQLLWWAGVVRKTYAWGLLFAGGAALAVVRMEDVEVPPFEQHELWRVTLTAAGALLSWITMYYDLARATPPEREDVKKHLLEKNFNGHFSYLTFYIIFAFLVYWTTCLVAELAWLWGYSHHEEMGWARKLLKFTYAASSVVAALGVTLSLLFLKFNWFEPRWRKEVLELYHSRGHTYFGPQILFTHLNQTPLSVLDVTVIKNRALLAAHLPDFAVLSAGIVVFGVFFIASTHYNFRLSAQYPYPFFHKVLGTTWTVEVIFVGGILVFLHAVTLAMYALAMRA